MIKRIINQKIKSLTLRDINDFAFKNNITLTNEESVFVLTFIKNHPTLLYQNLDTILSTVKREASFSLYQKAKPLLIEYYKKYKNYL